ncbi:MAG: SPFH domain-containing protein [Candidatus Paceibacterota bacterium]
MKTSAKILMLMLAVFILAGCTVTVPPGYIGRVRTPSGWGTEILPVGNHWSNPRDKVYLLETTNQAFNETLNILVNGKVNLKYDFTCRVRANVEDKQAMQKAFESVLADAENKITVKQMYDTFIKMKAQAIPRQVYEVQPDINACIANSMKLGVEVRKQLMEASAATPLAIVDSEISNYDWPASITAAQEKLAATELLQQAAKNEVKADLERAQGQVEVEKAQALVEKEKAEGVAGGIRIVKEELKDSPEYLVWWQIRALSSAAQGPNNCFIMYPYGTNVEDMKQMMGNSQLTQMLHPDGIRAGAKAEAKVHPKEVIDLEKFSPEEFAPKPEAPAPAPAPTAPAAK